VQGIRDARQSLRAFRMAIGDFMTVKYRVIEQRCCHVQSLARNRSAE
jgi:pyruvate/oxaloacetate carboxyltransferase